MAAIREQEIVLEICPTSNLLTRALARRGGRARDLPAFVEHGVPLMIATDGPEMMRTHLRDELELLQRIGALDEGSSRSANRAATRRASSRRQGDHTPLERYAKRAAPRLGRFRSKYLLGSDDAQPARLGGVAPEEIRRVDRGDIATTPITRRRTREYGLERCHHGGVKLRPDSLS